MIINTNSWHYKFYRFTYSVSEHMPPGQTNLCQYTRRLSLVPVIAFVWMLIGFVTAMFVIMAFVFGPIFGYVPHTWNPTKFFEHDMNKYLGLKLGKKDDAFRVSPWHVILAILFVGIHVVIYHYDGASSIIMEGKILGSIVAIIAAMVGLIIYFSSDTSKVFTEYLAAKKQKVCPVVEFQSPEQENKS